MTDTPPGQVFSTPDVPRTPEADAPEPTERLLAPAANHPEPVRPRRERRGLWIRIASIAVLPLLAFGVFALQQTSLLTVSAGSADDPGTATALLAGLMVAVIVAFGAAWWLDRELVRRLEAAADALESGDLGQLRDLVGSRGWGGLRRLATAVRGSVAGSQESAGAAEQLKALQESADDLSVRISRWAQSENPPRFDIAGGEEPDPLAELRAGLGVLARHLDERRRETLDAARMARGVVDEASGEIARAGVETGRVAREIASLGTGLTELRKLTAQLTAEWRTAPAKEADETPPADPARWSRELRRAERALIGLAGVRETVERIERASVRATLEAAAGQMSDPGEDRPALDLLRALRQAVVDCRHAQEGLESVETSLGAALSGAEDAAGEWTRAAGTRSSTNGDGGAHRDLGAAVNRIEHWAAETAARIERLAGVAERLAKQSQSAWAAARAGSDDLGGVVRRLEDGTESPDSAGGEQRARA